MSSCRQVARALGLSCLVLLVAGCGQGGTGSGTGQQGQPGTPRPSATVAPSPATTAGTARPAQVISVQVRDGAVRPDPGRVEVALGSRVRLEVSSDRADEVHVHGYDRSAAVPAGGTATLTFTADIPGVFEVELHEAGIRLTRLQVS